jgi:hypothetical protein
MSRFPAVQRVALSGVLTGQVGCPVRLVAFCLASRAWWNDRENDRGAPQTARSVAWCSASIWSAPVGSGLLRWERPSIASGPDGSSRIVWMINGMIKRPGGRAHPESKVP